MDNREYAYMKRYRPDYAVIIQYCWGKYYIARICEDATRGIAYTIREYKTLSGAEKYLLTRVDGGYENKGIEPEISYGTEQFIREGSYWRAKK